MPGIPGWPVCMIDHERIMGDTHITFECTKPCAYDWLAYLAGSAIEII